MPASNCSLHSRALLASTLGLAIAASAHAADEQHRKVEASQDPTGARTELTVATDEQGRRYLADGSGRAVYLLEADPKGESTCQARCADVWPPLHGTRPEAEDPGVRERMITTIEREDGSTQVVYNGHPLYYYAEDRGPGRATGHEVTDAWGEWYLVSPDGQPLGHGEAHAAADE